MRVDIYFQHNAFSVIHDMPYCRHLKCLNCNEILVVAVLPLLKDIALQKILMLKGWRNMRINVRSMDKKQMPRVNILTLY